MKAEFFKAVCPLEIGDTVAIKATKDGETKEALYLPQGCTVITTAAVALHKVTDIATLHYLKKGETQFLYELDGCGKYEQLTVKVPVREFADELTEVYKIYKYTSVRLCRMSINFILP